MDATPVIFRGGTIHTMADDVAPDAVLVEKGRVMEVGSERECRGLATSTPRLVELDGRCLMPGFIDAHMHMLLHGSRLDWVDLSECRSLEAIVSRMSRYGRDHPEARAIQGYGYDQTLLAEHRHPTSADLDRAERDRPVRIQHISGHGYVLNTQALRECNITRDTQTPAGGRLDRNEDGEPNGLVFDAACDLLTGPGGVKITNHGPNFHLPLSQAERDRLMLLGQESFLAAGVTAVCDAQVTELEMSGYLSARDSGHLHLKVQVMMLSSQLDHLRAIGLGSTLGDERLKIGGVKFYADGSVLARTAYLGDCCGGYHGDHRDGYLYHEPEELIELLTQAHRLGLPTATHAQGPLPIGLVLDAVQQARAELPRPTVLHRIEHCGFPTSEQIIRMRNLGVVPVPQPLQVRERADSLMAEFGPSGGRFYPYGEFRDAGLGIVISSDAPVTDPAPMYSAWAAITRETAAGDTAGGDELKLTRDVAIAATNRVPAHLLRRPGEGEIRVGSAADLVLLDADPYSAPLDALPEIRATETWIDGRAVWTHENGTLATSGLSG